jgi:GTP-binding protein
MKVTSALFSACVTSRDQVPKGKPIIALVGRSNVGKSALINTLACRKELAKTSSMPGKTLTINFYEINEEFYLVDLPGYGYAKASKVTRERIQKMMDEFFQGQTEIVGIIQVLDIRHIPSAMDQQMFQWITDQQLKYLPVLTKADKLTTSEAARMKREILKKFRLSGAVAFSGKTRQGRDELLNCIAGLLSGAPGLPVAGRQQAEGGPGEGRRRNRPGGAGGNQGPGGSGSGRSGERKHSGPGKPGPGKGSPERGGPGKPGPDRTGSEKPGTEKPGADNANPEKTGPERTGSEKPKEEQGGKHRRRNRRHRPNPQGGPTGPRNPTPVEGGS